MVAFYDIHGINNERNGEMLFFVLSRTPHETESKRKLVFFNSKQYRDILHPWTKSNSKLELTLYCQCGFRARYLNILLSNTELCRYGTSRWNCLLIVATGNDLVYARIICLQCGNCQFELGNRINDISHGLSPEE
jgi:hypothetical protein